ncbi:MAG: hypothetical protein QW315_01125 [Candidatus Hadarchaeum sp.]
MHTDPTTAAQLLRYHRPARLFVNYYRLITGSDAGTKAMAL